VLNTFAKRRTRRTPVMADRQALTQNLPEGRAQLRR
jgi:hypothetical protein